MDLKVKMTFGKHPWIISDFVLRQREKVKSKIPWIYFLLILTNLYNLLPRNRLQNFWPQFP